MGVRVLSRSVVSCRSNRQQAFVGGVGARVTFNVIDASVPSPFRGRSRFESDMATRTEPFVSSISSLSIEDSGGEGKNGLCTTSKTFNNVVL